MAKTVETQKQAAAGFQRQLDEAAEKEKALAGERDRAIRRITELEAALAVPVAVSYTHLTLPTKA